MKRTAITFYKHFLSIVTVFALLTSAAIAQSTSLEGDWLFRDKKGSEYRMEFTALGNSWIGAARSKVLVKLKLNPAGLKNQWVGNLNYFEDHEVKATLKNGTELLLTDLEDGEVWTLRRPGKD